MTCRGCDEPLKKVPGGWAHTDKAHWVDQPHKAVPARLCAFCGERITLYPHLAHVKAPERPHAPVVGL